MFASKPFRVVKFGGTSVGAAERIQKVVHFVMDDPDVQAGRVRPLVVASALGGVTDKLLEAIRAAQQRDERYHAVLDAIQQRHEDVLVGVALPDEQDALRAHLDQLWKEVRELLTGVYLLRECSVRFQDAIISAGERGSVPLVAAAFRAAGHLAEPIEATSLVVTDDHFGEANVDFAATRTLVRQTFVEDFPTNAIPIVTGFIARTPEGVTTTLGRSGSDYTATILADALDAQDVVIWSDVDGVLSADPRIVPDAYTLPQMSYAEAGELAYFGAKVLHPRTMRPLARLGLPLISKNTMNPASPGTRITAERIPTPGRIRAVTSLRNAALIRLEGTGIVGAPDLTARAFATLADAAIEVVLISQASSEQSLCLVVRGTDAAEATRLLQKTFARELERGDLLAVGSESGVAVVAVVGDFMRDLPGLAGRMFATLGKARVNVLAIAEGSSETNISAVVADADAPQAVRALHEAFAMRRTRAHLVVIGAGHVGTRLLDLLAEQADKLLETQRLHLRLVGAATSSRMVWDPQGIPFAAARERLDQGDAARLDELLDEVLTARLERLIVIDATASEQVARRYPDLLRHGVAVVTPNKTANTLDQAFYDELREAALHGEAPYLYETTVGAGLAILSTLREAVRTGDTVRHVEGVLSGTLSYLFNALRDGVTFSEAVQRARTLGYAEPDPRDDLSGLDVARKLLILAREIGHTLDLDDVQAESLIPLDFCDLPLDEFLARLPELDERWAQRHQEAQQSGQQLQYVCSLNEAGEARAEVMPVPVTHLNQAAHALAVFTQRYAPEPLIIQGPGASVDITAAVLLADIVRAVTAMR